MSTPIRIRRSAVPGKVPTVEQVQLGELAVNTYDGKAFLKKDVSGVESIVNIGGGYPGKTYFVTAEGLDTNDGESISSAFATLKHALSLTVIGDTVELSSGTFTEIFPLTVPPGVIVRGKGIRSTIIQPTSETERNDAFLLNGETTVEDVTVTNFYYDSSADTGYGFRFASGMVTSTRSPYVLRVTVLTRGSDTSASDPYGFDTADSYPTSKVAGRGAFIDGSVVASNTLEPSMLFNEVTFITPNQTGLRMTNGARAEWVNCFTYFSSISVDGTSGSVGVASTANATLKLSGITTTVTANQVIKYYQSGSPVAIGTVVSTDGDYIVINGKGSGTFNSVGLGSAQDVRIFESDGTTQVGTASTILWADYQKFGADLRSIGSASNFGTVGVRGDGVGVQLRLFGYNFGCVGAGKTFTQDPTLTVRANEAVQLNGGRVYFQSVDQEGNFRVGNIFEISQETGAVSLASTSDINIAGTATIQNLNVTGVSTFANPLEFNSNLYISGISTFANNVAITGFTTFSSDSMLESNLNVAGITTTATFRVTGISTLMGDVELESNLRVAGVSTFSSPAMVNSDLNVTGIATVGNFRVTGLSTITGDANFTNNVNIGGITTTSTFRVTGISTLTGDVELENNLQVAGVSTFASPAMINSDLNVTGIATVGNFRVTGISTLTGDTNFTNNVNVGGITTTSTFRVTGISTLTGDVELEGNLDVAGVSTFSSPAMVNSDLNVSGTTTTGNFRVAGISTLTGDVQLWNNLHVAGVTTFVGVTTYQNDLYVGNDLFVLGDTRIVGVLTVGSSSIVIDGSNNQINIGAGVTAHTDQVSVTQFTASGVSTFAQNVDIRTDLNVNGVTTSTALKISGVSTFSGDVELDTNLRVAGVSTFNSPAMVNSNLNVTGVTTTRDLNVIGVTTIGSSAILNDNLQVAGITTLSSALYGTTATLSDNVTINSNLTVAGNVTIGGTTLALTAQELKIKDKSIILGITTNAVDADVSTDTSANHGGIAIASTEGSPLVPLYVTGINTSPNTYKQFAWVKADTMGAGTTDAWLSNYAVGIGSTLVPNDIRLAVGGIHLTDTNVTATKFIGRDGTISYLDGDNLYYTGIGSINTLYANAGIVTNLSVTGVSTLANVQIGYGATDLIVNGDARVTGILTVGTASITINGTTEEIGVGETTRIHTLGFDVGNSFMHSTGIDVDDIHSSGISSLTTLYVSGISTFDGSITANSIQITGVGINTFENVNATNLTTKYFLLDDVGLTIVSESSTIGINTDTIGITTTNVAIGDTVISDTAMTTPFAVTGFTADGLSVIIDGLTENETEVTETVTISRNTGIGTFGTIQGSIGTIDTLYSVTGIITTLNGTTATYTTLNGTDGIISNLTSSEIRGTNLNYSGLGTITTFESTLATIGISTLTTSTITTLTSDDVTVNNTGYVENLTYNIGIATELTVENTNITGILTANNLNITGQTYFTEIAAGIASANTGIITNFTSTNLYSDYITVTDVNTGITTADVEIGIGTDILPINVIGLEVGDFVIAPSIPGGTTILNTPYLTIVSAASTLGATTSIVGIATTGVIAGDYIKSTSISQGTTVSTILTDAVEISSPSTNITEISQVVEIYRLTGLGITISNASINTGISTELVSIERGSGVGVGRFSTLYVNSGIITSLSTNEIDLTGSLSVTDVTVSSAATITSASIVNDLTVGGNVTLDGTITANAGIVTNLTAGFGAIVETSAVIVSAASTLGVATDRIGITTDGVLVGDAVQGQYIQEYTLVSEILNDIVVFDQASSNVSEQTPTINITRSNNNGIGTVSTLYVNSGIATFFNITEEVVGVSTITRFVADDIIVSGVTTTTDLYVNTGVVTDISGTNSYYIGVSTADTLYSNVGFVTTLSGDNFNYTGISSAATLNINVGLVTHVSGTDLYYSGISSADTLYTNTGFVTTLSGTRATYTDADITYGYISGVGTAVNLISTVGFVTFVTGENLNYTGVGTIQNLEGLGIGYTNATLQFVNSIEHTVTGVSTIESLFVNVGIATTLSGDRLTYNIADLTDTYTSGVSSISTLKAAVGLVTYASGTNLDYAGVGTINFLEGNNLSYTGIVTLGIVTATTLTTQDFNLGGGALNFTGIATITNIDSVNVTATYITGENLNYSGIGTINVLNLYEVQTEAFTTTSSFHVGVGGSLFSVVSGIGSVGIGTTNAREKLHVYGNIMYGDDLNTGTTRVAISSDAATTIHESLSRLEYRSVEYQIQATTSGVGSDGRYQFTRLLAIHDGTVAYNVEYANVGTGTDVASYIVDIDEGLDAGYIRLQATPAQTGITTFVVNFVGYRI